MVLTGGSLSNQQWGMFRDINNMRVHRTGSGTYNDIKLLFKLKLESKLRHLESYRYYCSSVS